jgi:hypothetical protein
MRVYKGQDAQMLTISGFMSLAGRCTAMAGCAKQSKTRTRLVDRVLVCWEWLAMFRTSLAALHSPSVLSHPSSA